MICKETSTFESEKLTEIKKKEYIKEPPHMENVEMLKNKVERLKNSMVPETNIPDLKNRLIAVGLIDRIEGGEPIALPKRGEWTQKDDPKVPNPEKRQEPGFVLVGSDVEKLYPSLRPLEAARLTRKAILESDIDITGVNLKKALRYIYIIGGVELIDRTGLNRLKPKWLGKRADLIALGGTKTNSDEYWSDTKNSIHRREAKMIIATMVEIGVIVTMGTHLYTFNGVTYVQLAGGPIGLRLTAALANLLMAFFDRALRDTLEREHIKILLSFRYVDDGRLGMQPISPGWSWYDGQLQFFQDRVLEDTELGPQKHTTRVIGDILNSIVPYLSFTTEDSEDFQNGKLPTLDCELWIENNKIMHQFYEKPQVSNRLLLKTTALASSSLKSSIIQEGVRRLKNTSLDINKHIRDEILNKFSVKLVNSGFSREETQTFLVLSVTSFVHKLSLSELPTNHKDFKPLHLSKEYMKEERLFNKARAKSGWFKDSKLKGKIENGKKHESSEQTKSWKTLVPKQWKEKITRQREVEGVNISTVMVVPNTDESELLNLLIQKEAQLCRITGYRTKLIEGNGVPLNRLLPAPTVKSMCDQMDLCQVCVGSEGVTRCQVRNVVYVSECLLCWDQLDDSKEDRRQIYIGETSRSLRERSSEHIKGAKRMDEENFISKHWQSLHPEREDPPVFVFRVNKVHRDALSRELHEAVLIQKIKEDECILNSKSEWNKTSLSRLCIEKDEWELRKELAANDKHEATAKILNKRFKESKKTISFYDALTKTRNINTSNRMVSKADSDVNGQLTDSGPMVKQTNTAPTHELQMVTRVDDYNKIQTNKKFYEFSRTNKRRNDQLLDQGEEDLVVGRERRLKVQRTRGPVVECKNDQRTRGPVVECNNDRDGVRKPRQTEIFLKKRRPSFQDLSTSLSTLPESPGSSARGLTRSGARPRIKLVRPQSRQNLESDKFNCYLKSGEGTTRLEKMLKTKIQPKIRVSGCRNVSKEINKKETSLLSDSIKIEYVWRPDMSLHETKTDGQHGCKLNVAELGYLWTLRGELPSDPQWVMALDPGNCADDFSPMSPTSPTGIIDMCDWEDYTKAIPVEEHNLLMREMNKLTISRRKEESQREKSLNSEIDPTVWEFVKLLSHKLDQNAIQNLYGKLQSPTGNMIVSMLEGHKLRSTFDFEKAIAREWKLQENLNGHRVQTGAKSEVTWNFRMIDMAAGPGTALNTIFELKEQGILRGAKRRLRFTDETEISQECKQLKMMEIDDLKQMDSSAEAREIVTVQRSKVKINVSTTVGGWHGGKRSPPKLQQPRFTSPKSGGERISSPRVGRSTHKRRVNQIDSNQSLIKEFFACSPRGNKVDSTVLVEGSENR